MKSIKCKRIPVTTDSMFNVCAAMGIWDLLCVDNYYRINKSENFVLSREFRIYVLFVFYLNRERVRCVLDRSCGIILQVRLWPISGIVLLVVSVFPLVPDCTIE